MIKYILIKIIRLYQLIPGPWHNYCKHVPSCSNYAIEAINEHGSLVGSFLSIKRIIRCNPWNKDIYDPVSKRHKKEKRL